jgi:hypothetical protein
MCAFEFYYSGGLPLACLLVLVWWLVVGVMLSSRFVDSGASVEQEEMRWEIGWCQFWRYRCVVCESSAG